MILDRFGNQGNTQDFNRGGGDADRGANKKAPLLPNPNQSPASTAQAAAANLTKILHALRTGAVHATTNR